MPFLEHFGLKEYPFALTPDPRLFYPSAGSLAILAALDFALARGDGLLKVVGEVGTGKTLLARLLVERLDAQGCATALLNAAPLQASRLPFLALREFGQPVENVGDPFAALEAFLLARHAAGKRTVLVVDEAQALGPEGLENARLLSNLETATRKLLQIVLFGQPELDSLLARPGLRQIAQRVQFSFATERLSAERIGDYVRFRLDRCARAETEFASCPRAAFTAPALRQMAWASRGVPRLIHLLGDKALLAAYAEGADAIEPRHVRRAARETAGTSFSGAWL